MLHHALPRALLHAEIRFGVQHSHDLLFPSLKNRIIRVLAFGDDFLPLLLRLHRRERNHLLTVRTDGSDRYIVKLKDILDHLRLLGRNRSLLFSLGKHHADFLLGHRLLLLLGIHAKKPQHKVGGRRQKPHERSKDPPDQVKDARHSQRYLLCFLHRDPLRHKFAEYQRKICQYQRNHNDADRLKHLL